MDGSLSCSDFEQQAKALSQASLKSSQVWEWKPLPHGHMRNCSCSGWLTLRAWPVNRISFSQVGNSEQEVAGGGKLDLEEEEEVIMHDEAALPARDQRDDARMFEYHVVHSATYNVPVLYLRGKNTAGGLMRPEEVWELCCAPDARATGMGMARDVPLPTPDEHPVTGEPFLFMHPCRTQESMAMLGFRDKGTKGNDWHTASEGNKGGGSFEYLLMWLSIYGGAVSLRLDPALRVTHASDAT